MCHCRPAVRTPCCGPACCGNPEGCGWCARKRVNKPPAIDVIEVERLRVEAKEARAEVEVMRASALAAAYDALGPDDILIKRQELERRLQDARDSVVCPTCHARNGRQVHVVFAWGQDANGHHFCEVKGTRFRASVWTSLGIRWNWEVFDGPESQAAHGIAATIEEAKRAAKSAVLAILDRARGVRT